MDIYPVCGTEIDFIRPLDKWSARMGAEPLTGDMGLWGWGLEGC